MTSSSMQCRRRGTGRAGAARDMSVLRPACPIAYHYRPEDLAGPPAFTCTTLYVAGGLYGNPYALDAIQARASAEPSPPEIVFNGDFHYLDTDPAVFRAIDDRVRACHATLGNIEYALTTADDTLGCGCDYPGYVPDAIVADSNAVVAQLRAATAAPEDYPWLAGLPRYLTVAVGEHRVGIVHGDPENLAGWRLALETVEPQQPHIRDRTGFAGTPTTARQVLDWFRRADIETLCCTHTGLPYAQDFQHPAGRYLVAIQRVRWPARLRRPPPRRTHPALGTPRRARRQPLRPHECGSAVRRPASPIRPPPLDHSLPQRLATRITGPPHLPSPHRTRHLAHP